jgi:hypothetical protein
MTAPEMMPEAEAEQEASPFVVAYPIREVLSLSENQIRT